MRNARSGKTVSAIAARFSNGEAPLTIAALFSFDGTSSALADLKRLWIYSQAVDQSLDHWLQIYHDGGARALKALGRETTGLHVHDTKGTYLAQVKRFFEVGDNAFALVNRATGLKQLHSIDSVRLGTWSPCCVTPASGRKRLAPVNCWIRDTGCSSRCR